MRQLVFSLGLVGVVPLFGLIYARRWLVYFGWSFVVVSVFVVFINNRIYCEGVASVKGCCPF